MPQPPIVGPLGLALPEFPDAEIESSDDALPARNTG